MGKCTEKLGFFRVKDASGARLRTQRDPRVKPSFRDSPFRKVLKPSSNVGFSLDLFPDRPLIPVNQPLIQTANPLSDHPLLL
jgi:hypothetical protein